VGLADKPLLWLHGEVKSPPFSASARIEAGVLLRRLQRGENLGLPHSRPMPDIGKGGHELRVLDEGRTWRIMYAVRSDAIVILEVFSKTTRKTPAQVLRNCRKRLSAYESAVQGKESKR
jgi:phage-related protein